MSDYLPMSGSSKRITMTSSQLKSCLIASSPYTTSKKPFDRIKGRISSQQVIWFLVNVAVLDVVHRVSRRWCPVVWHTLQSLQLLIFPPFKWVQRWGPLKCIVKGMQALSRPLLFLSVVRTFSDYSRKSEKILPGVVVDPYCAELPTNGSSSNSRTTDEPSESVSSSDWLLQLREELKNHGLIVPERFNDDELQRFYAASDGNFACLHQSLKRTIHWRETYRILPPEELEAWPNLVFWHGSDVKLRPCLIIRLGLVCSSLMLQNKLSFVEALVSQIEYGVVNLLNKDDPTITVLVDCQGLTPLRFPMKMLRSCAILMQEHYPNRLGTLLVVRLPPVVRVLSRTFLQVLSPATRQKLQVGGKAYQKFLSEFLQSVPSFLGGPCTCYRCGNALHPKVNKELGHCISRNELKDDIVDDGQQDLDLSLAASPSYGGNFHEVLGSTVISFLLLWVIFVVVMGIRDSGRLSFLNS